MAALRYPAVCPGIEVAARAWVPLGWRPVLAWIGRRIVISRANHASVEAEQPMADSTITVESFTARDGRFETITPALDAEATARVLKARPSRPRRTQLGTHRTSAPSRRRNARPHTAPWPPRCASWGPGRRGRERLRA